MDLDEIRKIIGLMDQNRLVEFEYEEKGKRIKLRRAENRTTTVVPAPVVPTPASSSSSAPAAESVGRADDLHEFKSPLVGTFYLASKPDAEPFVQEGDEVTPDNVLCIIEAMKVMNEIKGEMNGIIREIPVKNGQAVEFGEVLFLIEKK